jgi:predicted class III extradiol MEMO1 family dioxygenase
MEELPSQNVPVQRPKVAIVPWDITCSGIVAHSGEILTTGMSHKKKPDRLSPKDTSEMKKVLQFKYVAWNFRGLGEEEKGLDKTLSGNIKISVITESKKIKCMRKTAGHTWTDYKTNTEIVKELNITPVLVKIQE